MGKVLKICGNIIQKIEVSNTIKLTHLWISAILTSNVETQIIKFLTILSVFHCLKSIDFAKNSLIHAFFFWHLWKKKLRFCLVMDGGSIENIYKESHGCLQKFAMKKQE